MLSETWYISWGKSIPVVYLLLHTVFEGAWKFSRLVCPTLISGSWNFIHILTDSWIGKREDEEVEGDVFFWLLWIVLALTGVSLFSSESQKGPKPFLQQRKEGVVLPQLGCWLTLSLCLKVPVCDSPMQLLPLLALTGQGKRWPGRRGLRWAQTLSQLGLGPHGASGKGEGK